MPEYEITKIDPTTYEYLKAKLTSEIGSDVKASVFRQYSIWLAGFTAGVAVLGLVSIAKLIPDAVKATADGFVQGRLAPLQAKGEIVIANLEKLASDTEKKLRENDASLEAVKQSTAKLKSYSEDAEQDLRVLRSRITDNKQSVEDVRGELISSIKKDLVTVPDFTAASAKIGDLANELLKLKADVDNLRHPGPDKPAPTPQDTARVQELNKIVALAAQTTAPDASRAATVFIQFTAFTRDAIRKIAAGLKDQGWTVPPEDQQDSAANLKEVRYFYDVDAAKAAQLATDLAAQVQRAGFARPEVSAKSFASFSGKKPKPGTLEVWLGLVPPKT